MQAPQGAIDGGGIQVRADRTATHGERQHQTRVVSAPSDCWDNGERAAFARHLELARRDQRVDGINHAASELWIGNALHHHGSVHVPGDGSTRVRRVVRPDVLLPGTSPVVLPGGPAAVVGFNLDVHPLVLEPLSQFLLELFPDVDQKALGGLGSGHEDDLQLTPVAEYPNLAAIQNRLLERNAHFAGSAGIRRGHQDAIRDLFSELGGVAHRRWYTLRRALLLPTRRFRRARPRRSCRLPRFRGCVRHPCPSRKRRPPLGTPKDRRAVVAARSAHRSSGSFEKPQHQLTRPARSCPSARTPFGAVRATSTSTGASARVRPSARAPSGAVRATSTSTGASARVRPSARAPSGAVRATSTSTGASARVRPSARAPSGAVRATSASTGASARVRPSARAPSGAAPAGLRSAVAGVRFAGGHEEAAVPRFRPSPSDGEMGSVRREPPCAVTGSSPPVSARRRVPPIAGTGPPSATAPAARPDVGRVERPRLASAMSDSLELAASLVPEDA